MSREHAWDSHPWAARLVKLVAYLGPFVVAVGVTIWISRQLPTPGSFPAALGAWLLLGVVATVIVRVLDRLARRLLPVAALLKLSLAFPGEVPSRYKVARSRGGSRELQAEVDEAREHGLSDDRTEAATTVLRLVAALSSHDRATRGHAERVRVFVDMIAEELDIDEPDVDRLRWAALLHDVGKIAVHPDVLNDPGRPSEEAWELLRTHPIEGARITAPLRPWLGHWALAIEQHHERWDGEGYPYGISGEQLSLGARVVAVADAYDVMTAARAYKQPMSAEEAREELARNAGLQFDPAVVRAFLSIPLNRLRWAVGPFSWLVSTPFGRPFQGLSSGAASVAAVAVATVAGAIGVGVPPADPPELPEIADVQEEPDAAVGTLAVAGEEVTIDEGDVAVVDVLANDEAPAGATLELAAATAPSGELAWEPDGRLTWTPPAGFTGTERLAYTVTDGTSQADGEVVVTVTPGNEPPRAVDDAATVEDEGPLTIDLLANDTDADGDPLTVTGLDLTAVTLGEVVDNGDGTITYTAGGRAAGTDTVTYTVSDGTAEATATLVVTVAPVDRAPRTAGDTAVVEEDGSVTIDVLANDDEPDGDPLTVVGVDLPGATTSVSGGTVTVTPAPDTNGTLRGTVTVTDGTTSVTSSLQVQVLAVNDAPRITAGAPQRSASGAGSVVVTGWATGIAPGPSDESAQSLSVSSSATSPGLFATPPTLDPATGDLRYAFATGAAGTSTVTFTVTDDGGTSRGGQDSTTVTTTLTALAGPLVVDDAATTTPGQAVVVRVLDNDDPVGDGALVVREIDDSATTLGSVVDLGDGVLRYEPAPGVTGTDTFAYTAGNELGAGTATVTVTIQP